LIFAAWPALAQDVPCGNRDAILAALERTWDEVPLVRGVTSSGGLYELTVAPEGSWTVLVTLNGVTCILMTGEGMEPAMPQPPG